MKKLIKFFIVGTLNTLVYGFLLWLFLFYDFLHKMLAVALAFLVAMSFQYAANRFFTFSSKQSISKQIPKYILTAVMSYIVTVLIVWVAGDCYGLPSAITIFLSAAGSAITSCFFSFYWVYR